MSLFRNAALIDGKDFTCGDAHVHLHGGTLSGDISCHDRLRTEDGGGKGQVAYALGVCHEIGLSSRLLSVLVKEGDVDVGNGVIGLELARHEFLDGKGCPVTESKADLALFHGIQSVKLCQSKGKVACFVKLLEGIFWQIKQIDEQVIRPDGRAR